jgi:Ca2+/Na+ antiporter
MMALLALIYIYCVYTSKAARRAERARKREEEVVVAVGPYANHLKSTKKTFFFEFKSLRSFCIIIYSATPKQRPERGSQKQISHKIQIYVWKISEKKKEQSEANVGGAASDVF